MGGLGNQMFQYATAKSLSIKFNRTLKLDLSWFSQQKLRNYQIGVFNIADKHCSNFEKHLFYPNNDLILKVIKKILEKMNFLKVFNEYKTERFRSDIYHVPKFTYLNGYFQSQKYFIEHEDFIRSIYKFPESKNFEINKFVNQINSKNSVSIHIRRGDYITNNETSKVHGNLGLKYYNTAINHILKNENNPHFFIFSDDIEWVRTNFKIDQSYTYVVLSPGVPDHEEMRLMSICKNNIIANSSFSWWGAWLNDNPDKIVIAPKKWFSDPKRSSTDLIPENWIRI
jgi:hypothetical protein